MNVALDKVSAIFGEESLEPSIAKSIFCYVDAHNNVSHINIAFVKQLCKLPHNIESDVAILKTLQVLSGDAIGYLCPGFEYVDDKNEIHNITHAEFKDAVCNDIDPFSGEKTAGLNNRILIFYYPDKTFPKRLIHK